MPVGLGASSVLTVSVGPYPSLVVPARMIGGLHGPAMAECIAKHQLTDMPPVQPTASASSRGRVPPRR